ncbi:glycerate kinase [Corynebacterium pacaense]|uniref:glycerate kinase family protein n=1 Tax=Corynebacterium pacaense TaxID=1816684 RepID=UPI0009BA2FA3|nr:glycerate kinase [Corynebacterium pacaense]
MRFIIAPDSFKESLSASQAALAMAAGIERVFVDADIRLIPIADGGEGTCEVITQALGGEIHRVQVRGPLGMETTAAFGYAPDSGTAIIEVAEAIGIHLIPAASRDIWRACSFGVGQLLQTALDMGAQRIILGLGGSVTNDGGAGMLHALGVRVLDSAGSPLPATPRGLQQCTSVDWSAVDPRWQEVEIVIASDVTSPATGPEGATYVFGPQKGAQLEDLPALDTAIGRWVTALEEASGRAIGEHPGAGAAGALATGLLAFFDATITPGADLILDLVDFSGQCDEDCIVFTGEGKIDAQTAVGKGPARVAELARKRGARAFAFGGLVDEGAQKLLPELFDAVIPINRSVGDLAGALAGAQGNLREASAMVCHILAAHSRS